MRRLRLSRKPRFCNGYDLPTPNLVNEYSVVNSTAVDYDDAGNLVADHRGYSYHYDYENRIVEIRKDNDTITVASYEYDALGRRIEKNDAVEGVVTRYYYDEHRVLVETELDGSSEADSRWYVYGNYIDEVLMVAYNGAQGWAGVYFGHDHLYSPVVAYDNVGSVVERYEYDAYGKPRVYDGGYTQTRTASDFGNVYLFTGRRVDYLDGGSLALQYSRNRYYDYDTGRWLQRDPLGIRPDGQSGINDFDIPNQYTDGMNLYQYVKNNPVNKSDPWGLRLSDPSWWLCMAECSIALGDLCKIHPAACFAAGGICALKCEMDRNEDVRCWDQVCSLKWTAIEGCEGRCIYDCGFGFTKKTDGMLYRTGTGPPRVKCSSTTRMELHYRPDTDTVGKGCPVGGNRNWEDEIRNPPKPIIAI